MAEPEREAWRRTQRKSAPSLGRGAAAVAKSAATTLRTSERWAPDHGPDSRAAQRSGTIFKTGWPE